MIRRNFSFHKWCRVCAHAPRWVFLVAGLAVGVAGCEESSTQRIPALQAGRKLETQASGTPESLTRAIELLVRRDEFEPMVAKTQVLYQLSIFGETLDEKSEWQPDPLSQRLPPDYRNSSLIKDLGNTRYHLNDADYLLEGLLLGRISRWATENRSPTRLSKWLAKMESERGAVGQQLAIAERLFDWTVRNIQLDPLLPYPAAQIAAPAQGTDAPRQTPKPPPMQGIPGPGYQKLPFEVLLFGHGDALERARIFILLARQRGIDVVVLAINEDFSPRARPWALGALLGEELYLFDPTLGLPLPSADGEGIGTLAEYRERPELLRGLDLDEEHKYPATADDLKKIIAFVEASPYSMTRRMAAVEANLMDKHQVTLVARPSKIVERLGKVRGINLSQIWTLGCEAEAYVAGRNEAIRQNPGLIATHFPEAMPFMNLNALYKGRHLHFMGRFESTEEGLGAKGQYLAARANKDELNSIATSPEAQKSMGILRQPNEPDEIFNARIANLQGFILRSKYFASYWLALAHFESGNFDAAIDWFKQRTIDSQPDNPWIPGAKYNLARCYESRGEIDKARDLLFVDESPQRHGNVLRARWLKR